LRHRFQIHLVTDRKQARRELARVVRAALRGGVDWAQLREKSGPALGLYEDAMEIIPEAHRLGARVSINDRADVALATGADGVHLAGKSLPPEAARVVIPPWMLLGVSVHGLQEAREAVEAGADYVTFGHVYPTSSKPGLPPRGVRELAKIVEAVDAPVLAIGGIDASNVQEVLATGASGIAVISAVLAADDPEAATRELRKVVDGSPSHPRHPFPEPTEGGRRHARNRKPGVRGG
jgi:thiamine-phosphate pyrophosphorylase